MNLRQPLALAALLSALACNDGGGQLPPLATATIGPDGGTLEVTEGDYAGLRLEVPPGALSAPVEIRALPDFASAPQGLRSLGRGVILEPSDLRFNTPVPLTLPYIASQRISFGVSFLARSTGGELLQLLPATDDPENPLATLPIITFSPGGTRTTLFVAERYFDGFALNDYLPLRDGNVWNFEGGLSLTVTATTTAPNLEGTSLFELRFANAERDFGVWLEFDGIQDFLLRGEFQTTGGDSYQHTHAGAVFVPFRTTLGQRMRSTFAFAGYTPFGATDATFAGFTVSDILVTKPSGSVITPAGEFPDLVRVEIVMDVTRDDGTVSRERIGMTLANEVGVATLSVFGQSRGLLNATVDGEPIPPPSGGGGGV